MVVRRKARRVSKKPLKKKKDGYTVLTQAGKAKMVGVFKGGKQVGGIVKLTGSRGDSVYLSGKKRGEYKPHSADYMAVRRFPTAVRRKIYDKL